MKNRFLAAVVVATMVLVMVPGAAVATNGGGLVGYWSFDAQEISKIADLSGNENHAYLWANAALDYVNIAPVTGNVASLYLPEIGMAYVHDSASLDIVGDITVAAWVRPQELLDGKFYTVMGKWNDKDGYYRAYLLGIRDGYPRFHISRDGIDEPSAESFQKILAGEWCHLVGSYDGDYLRIYVDGVEMGSTELTDSPAIAVNDQWLMFGGDRAGGVPNGISLKGNIDEAYVFGRTLSAEEIGDLFSPSETCEVTWLPPISNEGWTLNANATLNIKFKLSGDYDPADVKLAVDGCEIALTYDAEDDVFVGRFRPDQSGNHTATVYVGAVEVGDRDFVVREAGPRGRGKGPK